MYVVLFNGYVVCSAPVVSFLMCVISLFVYLVRMFVISSFIPFASSFFICLVHVLFLLVCGLLLSLVQY